MLKQAGVVHDITEITVNNKKCYIPTVHFRYGSKDITLFIFNCDLISCTTPTCFSTFYQCTTVYPEIFAVRNLHGQ